MGFTTQILVFTTPLSSAYGGFGAPPILGGELFIIQEHQTFVQEQVNA